MSFWSHGDPAVVVRSRTDSTKLRRNLRRQFRSIKSDTNFGRELGFDHPIDFRTSVSLEIVDYFPLFFDYITISAPIGHKPIRAETIFLNPDLRSLAAQFQRRIQINNRFCAGEAIPHAGEMANSFDNPLGTLRPIAMLIEEIRFISINPSGDPRDLIDVKHREIKFLPHSFSQRRFTTARVSPNSDAFGSHAPHGIGVA